LIHSLNSIFDKGFFNRVKTSNDLIIVIND
jgi:hypothetical protein